MHTIVLRLDSRQLDNPDVDIRYQLPDLLAERSGGVISDDGYDYVGAYMVLYLRSSDIEQSLAWVLNVVNNDRVLDNDLQRGVVVAVKREGSYQVVYPQNFEGPFLPE
jgi:hypothetical protein